MYTLSRSGLATIAAMEMCRVLPYTDRDGRPCVGYSHVLSGEEQVTGLLTATKDPYGSGVTEPVARRALRVDLRTVEDYVNRMVPQRLYAHEFDTIVSWVWSIGIQGLKSPNLFVIIRAGRHENVPMELAKWIRQDGAVSQTLIARRRIESDMWVGRYPEPIRNLPKSPDTL